MRGEKRAEATKTNGAHLLPMPSKHTTARGTRHVITHALGPDAAAADCRRPTLSTSSQLDVARLVVEGAWWCTRAGEGAGTQHPELVSALDRCKGGPLHRSAAARERQRYGAGVLDVEGTIRGTAARSWARRWHWSGGPCKGARQAQCSRRWGGRSRRVRVCARVCVRVCCRHKPESRANC